MAFVVSGQVPLSVILTETLTIGANSVVTGNMQEMPSIAGGSSATYNFTNGTSTGGTVASLIDLYYCTGAVVLASSASQTYTLSALTDSLGRAVALVRVRAMLIVVSAKTVSANDNLTVGAAATNPWVNWLGGTTPTVKVRDALLIVDNSPAGIPVAAGSNDQLKITNSGANSMTFQLVLAGNST